MLALMVTCAASLFSPYGSVRRGVQTNSDGQSGDVGEGQQQLVTAHRVACLNIPQLSVSNRHGNPTLSKRGEEEEVRGGVQSTTVSLETKVRAHR